MKGLDYLLSQGKKVFLITNNSARPRETINREKLGKFGFMDRIPLECIYTSAYVAAKYLVDNDIISDKSKDKVYCIG